MGVADDKVRGSRRYEEAFAIMKPTDDLIARPLITPLRLCFNWEDVCNILSEKVPMMIDGNDRSGHVHGSIYDTAKSTPHITRDSERDLQEEQQCLYSSADQLTPLNKFYMVVFRSKRSKDANSELLYQADADAHEEAKESGGLLTYWYGTLNAERECFATCIWRSRKDASQASRLPKHLRAASLASRMYDFYRLERYWLSFSDKREPIFENVNDSVPSVTSWESNSYNLTKSRFVCEIKS
ncbi:hypothetical protein KP509_05G015200 [Ceratopteris richardii]|uniref:Uncharacterized protein n=1 Tax=Ceratopteris richardii TaxID=49495 RepID=A0A8T2UJJ1_CERRI|nr:hypothetical protein KP509_05G015200 [Ceratopteris richardii]